MPKALISREFRRISTEEIFPNPNQPRRIFDEEGIAELAKSIESYGVITPLTVRKTLRGYELVAGERRLRAAKRAGVKTVPCYIVEVGEKESSLMAIVENLQRQDLDFFEEALSLRCLIEKYGLTQQQTAERIGKTQSSVANKLRLLRLLPETTRIIRERGLSERHARTLLRLPEELQQSAAETMAQRGLTVQQAEEYVDRLISGEGEKPQSDIKTSRTTKKPIVFVKDVRIFYNSLMRGVETMRSSGLDVKVKKEQEGENVVFTVTVPNDLKGENKSAVT